jgi:hypothetical protein
MDGCELLVTHIQLYWIEFMLSNTHPIDLKHGRSCKLVNKHTLKPLLSGTAIGKRVAADKKMTRDEHKFEGTAPTDVTKIGVAQAMVDIHVVANAILNGHKEAMSLRYAATVAIAFIIFNNAPVGRPGEWEKLTRSAVELTVRSGSDFIRIEAADHKTGKTYGAVGKYCPPGTLAAMGRYLAIDNRKKTESDLFLIPKRDATKSVNMSRSIIGWMTASSKKYVATAKSKKKQ